MSKEKYSGPKVTNTETFIRKARWVHGDSYSYPKTVYKSSREYVTVTCPLHGDFVQQARSHLEGYNCKKCSQEISNKNLETSPTRKRRTTEDFIRDSTNTHGNLYDYSKVNYRTAHEKVVIGCCLHGDFLQTPNSHIRGAGCPTCSGNYLDHSMFIKKCKDVHGHVYDYSHVEYVNNTSKVKIICREHGEFLQAPNSHLSGAGCPRCVGRGKTTEDIVEQFIEIIGDKYDYSHVVYTDYDSKVKIICKEHGAFWQHISNHLKGWNGCPECSRLCRSLAWKPESSYGMHGYYGTSSPSNLYVLILDEDTIKVGVAKDICQRVKQIQKESGYSPKIVHSISGPACEVFDLEQRILYKEEVTKKVVDVHFAGSRECLYLSELPKVLQIIEDWEKSKEESFSETS